MNIPFYLPFPRTVLSLLLTFSLQFGLSSKAISQPQTPTPEQDFLPLLREIISEAYPELAGITLTTGSFSEPDSFFQSNFELLSLFSEHPIYRIEINPQLWQNPPPPLALKAVLAHELAHTLDYHQGKIPGILHILNQLRLYESLRSYEHHTDLQAIFRGFGPGLKAYREWLYLRLTAQAIERKKAIYYSPEEIEALMLALSRSEKQGKKEALMRYWRENVPLNLEAIQQDLKQFDLPI
ncbi:MAG: hypothetical protein AB7I41_25255 [Candidatus Sericytochromatia bacterium]